MRRISVAAAAVFALIAGLFVAVPAGNAANVTFVEGLTKGRFGAYQVFDVSRTPSLPTCTRGVPNSFKVTVTSNGGNPDGSPYSGAARRMVDLNWGYLMFFRTDDSDYPWGIRYYNRLDQELRWNGTQWIKPDAAGWARAKPFSEGGNIVAVTAEGFLHISKETGTNWNGGYGTFISITKQREPGERIAYRPDEEMNTCGPYVTPNFDGTSTTERGPVVNLATTKTILVPDHPLGPASDSVAIKRIVVSAGELEGPIKPDVTAYDWGVATAGTDSLRIKIFPVNGAAAVRLDNVSAWSGFEFTGIAVAPGAPKQLHVVIASADGSTSKDYFITLTAYPTNIRPEITELSSTTVSNEGGTRLTITGRGLTFAKGVTFTPNASIYSARAVTVEKTSESVKNGKFKLINDRKMEVVVPAVPNPAGGFYTGDYNVVVDTPFANSAFNEIAVVAFKAPQKPVSPLQWAKNILTPGITKLLSLPVKLNTGKIAVPSVKVSWLKFRAKPSGDFVPYSLIQKADGLYIDIRTTRPVEVTVTLTADGTSTFAPYYVEHTITS